MEEAIMRDESLAAELHFSVPAVTVVTGLTAILLDEAGRPARPTEAGKHKISCSHAAGAVTSIVDQAVYDLPDISLAAGYEPQTFRFKLKAVGRGTAVLSEGNIIVQPVPQGFSQELCLSFAQAAAAEPSSSEADHEHNSSNIVRAGEEIAVLLGLKGTEADAGLLQNAPDCLT